MAQETPRPAPPTRDAVDGFIAAGKAYEARAALSQLWHAAPGPAIASFVNARFERLRGALPMTPCRLAILRSFTVEPVVPILRATAFLGGIDLCVHVGDFNTYTQEIVEPTGALYAFKPDVVILAVQARDVAPDLWAGYTDLSPDAIDAAVSRVGSQYRQLVETFRSHSTAHLILQNLAPHSEPSNGVADATNPTGQRECFRAINAEIARAARATRNAYVCDYEALVARRGEAHFDDPRKALSAGMPIAANELLQLAREWSRFLHPIAGRVCKVVAVDLDNTLWGGVIGEDGLDGLKLGPDYKGAPWQMVQRALLDLYHRGIILAVCSKNNPAEAREAIERHPGMLLRPDHFAAMRTNWTDKATNLREIAAELNVGVDAVAFLDDNPAERDWVRRELPEVAVIELPDDPWGYARAIRDTPQFERLSLTSEDRERGRQYVEQRQRAELQQSTGSLEDFYRSLAMKVEVAPVTPQTLARAAQLTQKTNQFNLTTRRYSEEQLADLLRSAEWQAWTVRVVDRFGDNGIVGVAMAHSVGDACEIDNFLLSCRVIGRTVETAFLVAIADAARAANASRLIGRFEPTKKNAPAKDFLRAHGFEEAADGAWHLDLSKQAVEWPTWIDRVYTTT